MLRVAGYTILEEIGSGTMGMVYMAKEDSLGRTVALKILRHHYTGEEEVIQRFAREAKLAASLNHPNIVTVYAAGRDGKNYYIAMEYVDGAPLSNYIRANGPLSSRQAVQVIARVAKALDAAHSKSIIHRDIKPNNILLDQDFSPKVSDFGLARVQDAESSLTSENIRIGTYRYMSPEQCAFQPATTQSDIYSLGVVFYEVMSAQRAFRSDNPLALVREIVDNPFPDIRCYVPDVPDAIVQILARMTAKAPSERYHSAREVHDDLQTYLETGGAAPAAEYFPPLKSPVFQELTPAKTPRGVTTPTPTPTPTPTSTPTPTPHAGAAGELEESPDCLIHFVESDRLWAEWVDRTLSEIGYACELREWDFKSKEENLRRLVAARRSNVCVVAVVSPGYLQAFFGDRVFVQGFVDRCIEILIFRVRYCNIPSTMGTVDCIDASTLDSEETKQALCEEVNRRRGKPRGVKPKTVLTVAPNLTPSHLRRGFWNIPYARAHHFVGRNELLQQIYVTLNEKKGVVTLLGGPRDQSGLGVTQAAIEYACDNENTYGLVWLIRADRASIIRRDIARLAVEVGYVNENSLELGAFITAAKKWLDDNSGWLLIFDGARQYEDVVRYLPDKPNCHVLITSPNTNWPAAANPIQLPALKRAESIKFIIHATNERNEGAAAALAAVLADIPLALNLACAYIKESGVTLDDGIDRILVTHKELWGIEHSNDTPRPVVATVLTLSLRYLARINLDALDFLKACAYIAPTDIRLALFASSAPCFPRHLRKLVQTASKLDDAIGALKRLHLLVEENDVFYIHTMIQDQLVEWLEAPMHMPDKPFLSQFFKDLRVHRGERHNPQLWAEVAIHFLREVYPEAPKTVQKIETASRLLPHALTILRHADRIKLEPKLCAALWRDIGALMAAQRENDRAAGALERAIALRKAVRGVKPQDLGPLYLDLARVHWASSDFKKTRANLEEGLAATKAAHGERHENVALILHDIGNVLVQMGDYAAARQYYRQALEIDERIHHKPDQSTARDLSSLGLVTQELGDFVGAYEYYERALDIAEEVYGAKHHDVSAIVKNLAALMQRLGNPEKARIYYQRAVEIDTEIHGPNYPPLAQYYNNLGIICQGFGDIKAAQTFYERALEINTSTYGRKHPKVAINMTNLANVIAAQGSSRDAQKLYQVAVNILTASLGEAHHLTKTAQRNLLRLAGC